MTTRDARRRRGRELRSACPRSSQGVWQKRDAAVDPVALIEESSAGRIAGLLPLRYARMAQSPFGFFRGAALIQARDLRNMPSTGITVQLCGDCHLANFGGFATAERNLIFDINDFDETYPGPWEWDVRRLVTSFVLASRHRKFSDSSARSAVLECVASYRSRMAEYAKMSPLDVWYTQIDLAQLREFFRRNAQLTSELSDAEALARRRTSETLFPKSTILENGRPRIVDDPPLVYHFGRDEDLWLQALHAFLARYRKSMPEDRGRLFDRYQLVDIAVKVVGVGSVGTRCVVALFMADEVDPLFLQAKEARRSVLESPDGKSRYVHQGERVVFGQRFMQAASDIFLGWAEVPEADSTGRDYYIRQLRDMKVSIDLQSLRPTMLTAYAGMCGWALARAHAKAGDAATIAGYLGAGDPFDRAMYAYASAYADQVESDYEAFMAAIKSGRVSTATEGFTPPDYEP